MDLGRFSVCVLMICLIRTTHPSGNEDCLCSKIPERNLTKPPGETCSGTATRFRYICVDGYVRKAGTSNLIKCQGAKWSDSTLNCIPNPNIPIQSSNSSGFIHTTSPGHNSLITSQKPRLFEELSTTGKPSITTHAPNSFETSSGPQNERSSEFTDRGTNKKQNTPGTVKLVQYTSQSSTFQPVTTIETSNAKLMGGELGIGLTAVILTCLTIAIIIFVCRRRTNPIPTLSATEMEPMNNPMAKVP